EDIADGETVFAEQASDVRLDEGEPSAGQNGGHASEHPAIEYLGLREVGDFGRASDAGRSGEERVLHDGTEESAGGERAGSALGERDEFFKGECAGARLEARAAGSQRQAAAVEDGEKQRGLVGYFHLLMEAGLIEGLPTLEEVGNERGVLAQGVESNWGGE